MNYLKNETDDVGYHIRHLPKHKSISILNGSIFGFIAGCIAYDYVNRNAIRIEYKSWFESEFRIVPSIITFILGLSLYYFVADIYYTVKSNILKQKLRLKNEEWAKEYILSERYEKGRYDLKPYTEIQQLHMTRIAEVLLSYCAQVSVKEISEKRYKLWVATLKGTVYQDYYEYRTVGSEKNNLPFRIFSLRLSSNNFDDYLKKRVDDTAFNYWMGCDEKTQNSDV